MYVRSSNLQYITYVYIKNKKDTITLIILYTNNWHEQMAKNVYSPMNGPKSMFSLRHRFAGEFITRHNCSSPFKHRA